MVKIDWSNIVSRGKQGKSGQVVKVNGNSSDDNMNIEQMRNADAQENQLFAFPRNIQQLLVDFVFENF